MNNIKQKILQFTLLLCSLLTFSGCKTTESSKVPVPEVIEIAILMPMTGPNSALGQQYNELIKMGLSDGVNGNINVISYDGSDEKQTRASMDKIIARHTKIILGPQYSPLAQDIAARARANNIIVITISNNPVLADSNMFVFGHAPLKQLERIINYYLDNDYKEFILLLPAGKHSQTVNKILQEMIVQKNATLVRSEFYSEAPESISKSVALVSDSVDNLNEMEDSLTKPVVFLSDDSKSLNLIFDSAVKHNLDKKAIIAGDNRIDIDSGYPVNISFTGSLNVLNSNVPERARQLGINHLSYMHALAYDLGRMTASYIGESFNREGFLARMNNKEPFIGLSGNIHFIDSIAQREYDVIRREDGVYRTISGNE